MRGERRAKIGERDQVLGFETKKTQPKKHLAWLRWVHMWLL